MSVDPQHWRMRGRDVQVEGQTHRSVKRGLKHQTLSAFPCFHLLIQLPSPAWAGDTRIMLLCEGYQGLFFHFHYMNVAPTMSWPKVPNRKLRAAMSVRKSQGVIRVGVLQCWRRCLYMNSLTTKINLPSNTAKETWTYIKPPFLSQQTSNPLKPLPQLWALSQKTHYLVSPAVLHHKGDLVHDTAKYSGCKTWYID